VWILLFFTFFSVSYFEWGLKEEQNVESAYLGLVYYKKDNKYYFISFASNVSFSKSSVIASLLSFACHLIGIVILVYMLH